MDVDILYNRSKENVSKLLTFLTSIESIYRRPDNKVIVPSEKDLSGMGYFLFSTRLGPLDVLAFIEQKKTYDEMIEDVVEIDFKGHILQFLDIKKMFELKKSSNDPKDKRRLPILEEILRQMDSGN